MNCIETFIARADRLEERYKRDKYSQDFWQIPVDLLKELRDELRRERTPDTQQELFEKHNA